jgi:hypothetical protein
VPIFLIGCAEKESPGEECLASLRMDLKDPDSGKVVSFESGAIFGILKYTATNSYGGRIQNTAYCELVNGKWSVDKRSHEDRLKAMTEHTQRLQRKTACIQEGKESPSCHESETVQPEVKQPHRSGR